MSWALSAITYAYIGKTAEAENRFNRYKRLSPLDPFAFFFDGFVTLIHLQKHDHEAAMRPPAAPSFSRHHYCPPL